MSLAVIFLLAFFQSQRSTMEEIQKQQVDEQIERHMLEQQRDADRSRQAQESEAVYVRKQFVDRFNHLIRAMKDFSAHYDNQTIDLKRIKALKKAMKELEKSDAFFKMDSNSGPFPDPQ